MGDRTKRVLKFLGLGVLWVYILSVRVSNETIFQHANNILVQNQIVEAIDRQLAETWDSVSAKAGDMFARMSGRTKSM
jgi:hypothetical protein